MSGITQGSRLEQLYALRTRIAQEIAAEEARTATDPRPLGPSSRLAGIVAAAREATPPPSSAEVRDWARANGYPVGATGRVPGEIVDRYLRAHREVPA